MAMYEFSCKKCTKEFEQLVFAGEKAVCPDCKSTSLEKNGLFLLGQVAKMESIIVKQICHLAILTVAKYHQMYEDN